MAFDPPEDPNILANLDWARALSRAMVQDVHLSEDLLQDALVTSMEKPPNPAHPAPRRWIGQVMRNLVRMHHRSEQRRLLREARLGRPTSFSEEPSLSLEQREAATLLQAELAKLPDNIRRLLHQRYFEDRPIASLAAEFQIPAEKVEEKLRSGRRLLRLRLEGKRENWMNLCLPFLPLSPVDLKKGLASRSGSKWMSQNWVICGLIVAAVACISILWPKASADDFFAGRKWQAEEQTALFAARLETESVEKISAARIDLKSWRETVGSKSPLPAAASILVQTVDPSRDLEIPGVHFTVQYLIPLTPAEGHLSGMEHAVKVEQIPYRLLGEQGCQSDEQGMVRLYPPEEATLLRISSGSWTSSHSLGTDTNIFLTPDTFREQSQKPIALPLFPRSGKLQGQVLDLQGNPVPGAKLRYWAGRNVHEKRKPDHYYAVQEDGSFDLSPIFHPQGFSLSPTAPGMSALYRYNGLPKRGGESERITLLLAPKQVVRVQVRDSNEIALSGVQISLQPKHKVPSSFSLTGGTYGIDLEYSGKTGPGGDLMVQAFSNMDSMVSTYHPSMGTKFHLLERGRSNKNLSLKSLPFLRGRVIAPWGSRASETELFLLRHGTLRFLQRGDSPFRVIQNKEQSPPWVMARAEGGEVLWTQLKPDHSGMIQEIVFPPGLTLQGGVALDQAPMQGRDGEFRCLPQVQVDQMIRPAPSWVPENLVHWKEDGSFEIAKLPQGRYLLTFGRHGRTLWATMANAGDHKVRLGPGSSTGKYGNLDLTILNPEAILHPGHLRLQVLEANNEQELTQYRFRRRGLVPIRGDAFHADLLESGHYVLCLSSRKNRIHEHQSIEIQEDRTLLRQITIRTRTEVDVVIDPLAVAPESLPIGIRLISPSGLPMPWKPPGHNIGPARIRAKPSAQGFAAKVPLAPGDRLQVVEWNSDKVLFETTIEPWHLKEPALQLGLHHSRPLGWHW